MINIKQFGGVVIATIIVIGLAVFTYGSVQPKGQIYLYGEAHGEDKIIEKELEIWKSYYQEKNLRHLFIEAPYYTAELLNLWMNEDNNEILNEIYDDWTGSLAASSNVKAFFETIKSQYPETVFHGTDVGHNFETTGYRYLDYLENNSLKDSDSYLTTLEVIKQGAHYYRTHDHSYRENMMVENFKRELDAIGDVDIMGIYGAEHISMDFLDDNKRIVSMAYQLQTLYDERIHLEDLTGLLKNAYPYRVNTMIINGKEYKASYFGKAYADDNQSYDYIECWRLEEAYEDFEMNKTTENELQYKDYPMFIEYGQVYVVDFFESDGNVKRRYFRSDEKQWSNLSITVEFTLD